MTELVFKGQNDQVLTNSLYTDTTESYKDEDGSLVVIKKTVYSKRMLDIIVEMKGVLSNRPYFHTFSSTSISSFIIITALSESGMLL